MAIDEKYKHLLFDLDGTLCDTREGIVSSLATMFKKRGYADIEESLLKQMIGPPLVTSFRSILQMDESEADVAVKQFRQEYDKNGILLSKPFEGAKETLEELKNRGYKLYIATSKPQYQADRIVEMYGLTKCFEAIVGSSEKRGNKNEVIEHLINSNGLQQHLDEIVMIGDRIQDAIGAENSQIEFIEAAYGYAMKGEFDDVNPKKIINNLADLL